MATRVVKSVLVACLSFALSAPLISTAQVVDAGTRGEISADGIVKIKSVYTMDETIARVKQDIASKGIMVFIAIDQSKLAADAGITLRPSTLLIFGNPPLGTLFIKQPGRGTRLACATARVRG